ncbi:polyamine aminopropyltransferase [Actibacterium sp. 188UL27-1]|uniref:polyamine aminopropyltransferase n=1 Tax=Actibacterium sp. 188UL27-1 TaxID=2786961 RepID=UPI0019599C9C|nr:polyamine aminopropyltransferase [Actibacterium sp. 188UL27-1]MBM7067403.1 polyamine aminopropyltransferase [Actibacterium sp. 188UL27-1]
MHSADTSSDTEYVDLPSAQKIILLSSILIVAMCGIVYELIIGAVSSYLLGNSVYQFSLTIGFFMFAMGVGSYASRFIMGRLIQSFIYVELLLAIIGGICSIALFMLFPAAPWLYMFGKFFFICTIGFLVGLEIPLLTRVLAQKSTTRESIADVLSLDYIGALFGSVAFPILLLPSLGLIASSFAIGLVNACVAAVNVIWLRQHLSNPRGAMVAVGLTVLALFVLTLQSSRVTSFAQHHLFFDQVVWKEQSPYQSLVVTNNWRKGDIRLFIDGHLQFSETDEYRYHEALVHPVMSMGNAPATVLVLGGGDGLAVREILRHPSVTRIDVVDLDPAMTELGTEFAPVVRLNEGAMLDERVTIINDDAFNYVRQVDIAYDTVIIDFPDPHNEALSKLYSVEFYTMVGRIMAEDAALITQSSSPFFAPRSYWTIAETLDEVFAGRTSFQISIPSFGLWGFHIATKEEDAGMRPFPDGLKSMDPQIFAAAQVFPRDIAQPEGLAVNSIFDPTIYRLYDADLNNR